jgi:hypothetical protein
MVSVGIQHHDVLKAHQVGHDALEHLPLGLKGIDGITVAAFESARLPFESSIRSRSLNAW